jgi:hypothetical protein
MEPAVEFYNGKTVKVMVGEKPGGGTDLTARTIAKHLGKQLDATVVVQQLTGGGKLRCRNHVWDAKPDGRTLGCADFASLVTDELYDVPGLRYEVDKLTWIGGVGDETTIFAVSPHSPIKSIKDLKAATGLKFGSTSHAGMRTHNLVMAAYLLDLDAKVITGLKGAKGVELAIRQEEVIGTCIDAGAYHRGVKAGGVYHGLFTIDTRRSKGAPEIPALTELMTLPKEKMELLELMLTCRPTWVYYGTTGLPMDRVAFLRQSYHELCNQAHFKADIEKIWYPGIPFVDSKAYRERAAAAKAKEKMWQDKFGSLLEKYCGY